MSIEQNLLRKRAKRLPVVDIEMWNKVDPLYRELVDEYLGSVDLSPATKKQYISALKQFGWFIYESLNNKPLYKIKKRDAMRYINYLREDRGMSSSGINLKKSAVSAFNQWVENYVADDYEDSNGEMLLEHYRNFMQGLPPVVKNQVHEKKVVTREEYLQMMKALKSDENYLGMAWLSVAFNVGARRGEIRQFKTSILDEEWQGENKSYKLSHIVRGKGRGTDGKPLRFMFNKEALEGIELWLNSRSYDSEYIFTTGNEKENNQIGLQWANNFCTTTLSHILGRRVTPHIFKSSCITYLLETGVSMKVVSKYVAHHESVETTEIYDLRDDEEERDSIFL